MINQDNVKKLLLKLQTPEIDFTVIFSGKKSSKVNGLYKTGIKEIIIHNQNFTNLIWQKSTNGKQENVKSLR